MPIDPSAAFDTGAGPLDARELRCAAPAGATVEVTS